MEYNEIFEKYRKANPLCVKWLENGRLEKATVVDHIVRIKEDDPLWINLWIRR